MLWKTCQFIFLLFDEHCQNQVCDIVWDRNDNLCFYMTVANISSSLPSTSLPSQPCYKAAGEVPQDGTQHAYFILPALGNSFLFAPTCISDLPHLYTSVWSRLQKYPIVDWKPKVIMARPCGMPFPMNDFMYPHFKSILKTYIFHLYICVVFLIWLFIWASHLSVGRSRI